MAERKTAIVTGAGQGIGASIAIALAKDGFDIVATALHSESAAATTHAVEQLGRKALPLVLDLRDQVSIERTMTAAIDAFGQIDVLVNNAGMTSRQSALEVTRDEWHDVMSVMLSGTFFMTQQMGRHLVSQKRPGVIISLASTHGLVGLSGRATYGIAKGGLIQMTRVLAIEWADYGIRVNAVAPGTIATPTRLAYFNEHPDVHQMLIQRIPVKHFGKPEDVGAAVAYLASPKAEYITGQTLVLDGGMTAA
jgi:NAD(P)-dependent dehydrogenase (short-subunit alcohol dehydrogenase family)